MGFGIYGLMTVCQLCFASGKMGLTILGLSIVWLIMSMYHPDSKNVNGYEMA
jgi:hypothetical protein